MLSERIKRKLSKRQSEWIIRCGVVCAKTVLSSRWLNQSLRVALVEPFLTLYNQQVDTPISLDAPLVVVVDGETVEHGAPAWRFATGKDIQMVIRIDEGARSNQTLRKQPSGISSPTRGALSRLSFKRFHVGQFHVSLHDMEAKTTLNEAMLAKSLRVALIDPFLET